MSYVHRSFIRGVRLPMRFLYTVISAVTCALCVIVPAQAAWVTVPVYQEWSGGVRTIYMQPYQMPLYGLPLYGYQMPASQFPIGNQFPATTLAAPPADATSGTYTSTADGSCDIYRSFPDLSITIDGSVSAAALANDLRTICNALSIVPTEQGAALQELTVRYGSAQDATTRAEAGGRLMYINGELPELKALFVHELAHNIDTGYLKGTRASGGTAYTSDDVVVYQDDPSIGFYAISWIGDNQKIRGMTDANFVSGYAKTSPQEDFAESYVLYVTNGTLFRAWAADNAVLQQKYNWIKDVLFDGIEFDSDSSSGVYGSSTPRPWDATKI